MNNTSTVKWWVLLCLILGYIITDYNNRSFSQIYLHKNRKICLRGSVRIPRLDEFSSQCLFLVCHCVIVGVEATDRKRKSRSAAGGDRTLSTWRIFLISSHRSLTKKKKKGEMTLGRLTFCCGEWSVSVSELNWSWTQQKENTGGVFTKLQLPSSINQTKHFTCRTVCSRNVRLDFQNKACLLQTVQRWVGLG